MRVLVYGVKWLGDRTGKQLTRIMNELPLLAADLYLNDGIPKYCLDECMYWDTARLGCGEKCRLRTW